VKLSDLVYEKATPEANYSAVYEISYKLQESYEAKNIIDSATFLYVDSVNFGKDIMMIHSLEFPALPGNSYILDIQLKDLQRVDAVRDYILVEKKTINGQQGFIPITGSRQPLFTSYIERGEDIKIKTNRSDISKLFVRCYFRQFPVATPPFFSDKKTSFNYEYDSLYTIQVLNGETGYFTLEREGFYHFQSDTTGREGITLYRFSEGYPELTTTNDLVSPLRYITTQNEYEDILSAGDRKVAVDNFWLNSAGNELRARNLIQRYYNNVLMANRYFTSYHEGWKTDRGLIYIIFGRPTVVYRGEGLEEWVYGEPENRNSLRFSFVKVINPFSHDDYMLLRSSTFKEAWYINVQRWRR
jgi:GWxTD domain-containing protein